MRASGMLFDHDNQGMVRPAHTSVQMLEKHPKYCHFVPLFGPASGPCRGQRSFRKWWQHHQIGTDVPIIGPSQNRVAYMHQKTATFLAACCSLSSGLAANSQRAAWVEAGLDRFLRKNRK
jgi:hypothetical protein